MGTDAEFERTTGGSGGTTTTVSTLAQFTAAAGEKISTPAVVYIQGVIEGSAKVRIGSNKTIVGLPGSRMRSIQYPENTG
jgi:pectate lyase